MKYIKICGVCDKEYTVFPYQKEKARFCSLGCYYKSLKGRIPSKPFSKGNIPWNKGKDFLKARGNRHWNWKGGKQTTGNGYVQLYLPEHPGADTRGRVAEHRYLMELKLGRLLKQNEVVHHINGKRKDNRIENLELYENNGQHLSNELSKKDENGNRINKIRIRPKRIKQNGK